MTPELKWLLIAVSFVCLIGFGFAGVLVSQAYERRQKSVLRMRDLVAPYRKIRVTEMQVFRPATTANMSLLESAAAVFGFNPNKQDQYPVRWWIVLGVTLVVARIVAGLAVDLLGSVGFIGMPILWIVMSRTFFGWVAGRRKKLLIQQFPDALTTIVRSVRVGMPVLGAIAAVAHGAQPPTSLECTRFANDLSVGVPLDEAVTEMGARNNLAEYRFFAIAISLQARTGGGLSETLENLADLIRKRLALRERGIALSSEARSSAMILGGMPVIMGAGLWLLSPTYVSVLFATSTGHKFLGAAAFSLSCGVLSMRAIIKKSLS
jgi:tight adherence protein B